MAHKKTETKIVVYNIMTLPTNSSACLFVTGSCYTPQAALDCTCQSYMTAFCASQMV